MKFKFEHQKLGIENSLYAIISGVSISQSNPELENQKKETLDLILRYSNDRIDNDEVTAGYVDILKIFGQEILVPAGMNLVKLVRERMKFPSINTAVDSYNIAAAKSFLAIGAHDFDKIKGDIVFDYAKVGEKIPAVNMKNEYLVNGGDYVYRDDEKILAWLDVRDTDLAKITNKTRNILLMIEGTAQTNQEYILKCLKEACELIIKFCGGKYEIRKVVGNELLASGSKKNNISKMKFKIDKTVFEKFPEMVEVVPIIYGFDASIKREGAAKFLDTVQNDFMKNIDKTTWEKDKRVVDYRKVFKNFGAIEGAEPSHVALTKRLLEGSKLPDINAIVNVYNAFSVKYLTPFGGENLDQACGDLVLTLAKGGERWVAIGSTKNKPALVGELIWRDDLDVTCRSWNWRQCERTKLTPESKNGYFVMDGFESNKEELIKIAKEFVDYVTENLGGKGEILILDKDHPEAVINFESKKLTDFEVRKAEKEVKEKTYYFLAKEIHDELGVPITHPAENFGDFAVRGDVDASRLDMVEKVNKVAGFTNIWLKQKVLVDEAEKILDEKTNNELKKIWKGKKIMVEYAHPNTHKELHIGHLRTLITGEALARLFESVGVKVFRANYQGDIGPHVAKAIWGVRKLLSDNNQTLEEWDKKSNADKAHFLGRGYIFGCQEYERDPVEIDDLNQLIYKNDLSIKEIYQTTRSWSLNYYADFYKRFYTGFDKLFFESEIDEDGRRVVEKYLTTIFEKGEKGAIIFDGSKYGLHKRVFITAAGTVTYEGKEMGLAYAQKKAFEYDQNVHVVGNEQAEYFKVVIKAMELVDSWFVGKQYHLPMGMVNLVGKKMSSRTGDIVTVDSIIDEVKSQIIPLIKDGDVDAEEIAETVTVAAIKFSILKTDPKLNSVFDIKKSIDIGGGSGPYLQYTYARCKSVLTKAKTNYELRITNYELNSEEKALLRYFYQYGEKIVEAAERFSPAVICEYLLNLARKYNEFYGKHRIIGEPQEKQRLFLTEVTAKIIKDGLMILGIKTLEKM